jgi:hypothetical protein
MGNGPGRRSFATNVPAAAPAAMPLARFLGDLAWLMPAFEPPAVAAAAFITSRAYGVSGDPSSDLNYTS